MGQGKDVFAGDTPAIFLVVAQDSQGIEVAARAFAAEKISFVHANQIDTQVLLADEPPADKRLAICVIEDRHDDSSGGLALEIGLHYAVDTFVAVFASADGLNFGKVFTHTKPTDEALVEHWQQCAARMLWEEACFVGCDLDENMATLLIRCATKYGKDFPIFTQEIPTPVALNYKLLLRAVFALGTEFTQRHQPGERVGLLLPTSAGTAAVFFATMMAGLVPVMLNFSAGSANLKSAATTAQVKTIYTAQGLLDKLEIVRTSVESLREAGITVELLEEVRANLSLGAKLRAVLGMLLPKFALTKMPGSKRKPQDEAVVLFTSGTEGAPKGVVLSNRNLVGNVAQILCRINVKPGEFLLNSLPVFHCFGMMGGIILPVAGGIASLQVPSPLLYKEIPEAIAKHKVTIIFSTSTFFGQYANHATKEMLQSLRLIIAGGEKLQNKVTNTWQEKFGKDILEAYGVTESTPGMNISIPGFAKAGSIGLPLPGMEYKLVPQEGIDHGGSLNVKGPNIMLGYMYADNPGQIVPPPDGFHDTGDIVTIDEQGYCKIVGRLKRFAKIAGEMVPLTQVENVLVPAVGEEELAAIVSVADAKRGEQLLFVTTDNNVTREALQELLKHAGMPELWAPRSILVIDDFPLLSTGKTNYPALADLVAQQQPT